MNKDVYCVSVHAHARTLSRIFDVHDVHLHLAQIFQADPSSASVIHQLWCATADAGGGLMINVLWYVMV